MNEYYLVYLWFRDRYNFYVDILIIPVSQKISLGAKHYKNNIFQARQLGRGPRTAFLQFSEMLDFTCRMSLQAMGTEYILKTILFNTKNSAPQDWSNWA